MFVLGAAFASELLVQGAEGEKPISCKKQLTTVS